MPGRVMKPRTTALYAMICPGIIIPLGKNHRGTPLALAGLLLSCPRVRRMAVM